jgi:hypothetical protein
MPFKSKAQQRKLFATNPRVAKEMAAKMTPADFKRLPTKIKKGSRKR